MTVGEWLWNIVSKDKNLTKQNTYGDKFQCIWIFKHEV